MNYVTDLLGRLIMWNEEVESCKIGKHFISIPISCLLNLAPIDGTYRNCYVVAGNDELILCEVEIDASHLHMQTVELDFCNAIDSRDLQPLCIEFG